MSVSRGDFYEHDATRLALFDELLVLQPCISEVIISGEERLFEKTEKGKAVIAAYRRLFPNLASKLPDEALKVGRKLVTAGDIVCRHSVVIVDSRLPMETYLDAQLLLGDNKRVTLFYRARTIPTSPPGPNYLKAEITFFILHEGREVEIATGLSYLEPKLESAVELLQIAPEWKDTIKKHV